MGEIHELGAPPWAATPRVRRIRLEIVTDPGRWPVLTKEPADDLTPFMTGKGDGGVDLLCGNCNHVLAEHLYPADKLSGVVLCCPLCNANNLA